MTDSLAGSGSQGPREEDHVPEIISGPLVGSHFEQAMLAEKDDGMTERSGEERVFRYDSPISAVFKNDRPNRYLAATQH